MARRNHNRGRLRPAAACPPQSDYYGEYDSNGVDLSLIRYMLRKTPLERLILMEQHARDTQVLFEYGRRHRETQTGSDR